MNSASALSTKPRILFAYGTLRQDLGYRTKMPRSGVSLGLGTISGTMYSIGSYPAVVRGGDDVVTGELLSFEHLSESAWDSTLQLMDEYEGVHYRREIVEVLNGGVTWEAWCYVSIDPAYVSKHFPIIPSGNWVSYLDWQQEDE